MIQQNLKTAFLTAALMLGSIDALISQASRTGPVPESKIDAVFAEWNRTDSPGCAVAVISSGEILFSKGYGMANLEQGAPIRPDTTFYAGSVSKQFVAASIGLLAEQGKLALDDDIRQYLPEIPGYGKPISIRHLIHHTSGLRDYLELWGMKGRNMLDSMREAEVLDLIARQRELNFTPGDQHLYSNSGYFLLALIVQRASGLSLREFARREIFGPLNMRSSHFHDDGTHLIRRKAEGYFKRDDGEWGALAQRFALVGSGGLYTTVEDLARWDGNFYSNQLGRGGESLTETLLQTGALNDGKKLAYAFGLVRGEFRGLQTVRHGGALGGYRAHLLRFPEQRFSLAILCNLANVNPSRLADQLAVLFLGDLLKLEEEAEAMSTPVDDDEQAAQDPSLAEAYTGKLVQFAGHYYCPELDSTLHVWESGSTLWTRTGFADPIEIKPVSEDAFSARGRVTLEFKRGENGNPSGLLLQAGRVRNLRCDKNSTAPVSAPN